MMLDFRRGERGQAAVITAFVMVGLLVAAGLAIDGGMAMRDRRLMQNAADASALSGTRKLAQAMFNAEVGDDEIFAEVWEYAERNGVEDPSDVVADYVKVDLAGNQNVLGRVGQEDSIPTGASGISTTAAITRGTSFMGLLGFDRARASAQALAVTGAPRSGSLRPFALPQEFMPASSEFANWDFTIYFGNCNKNEGDCIVTGTHSTVTGTLYAQHRGWLNLGYMWNDGLTDDGKTADGTPPAWLRAPEENKSSDSAEVIEWMKTGSKNTVYAGDYIHALSGAKASAVNQLTNPQHGDPDLVTEDYDGPLSCLEVMLIPVYDRIDAYEVVKTYRECSGYCDAVYDSSKPANATQGGGSYYHVSNLAAVCVVGTANKQLDFKLIDQTTLVEGESGNLTELLGYGDALDSNAVTVRLWKISDS